MTTAAAPALAQWRAHAHTVWPSVSAGPMALVARLGDWTWEAVTDVFSLDVLHARTPSGAPAYLSFHYCRYRGTPSLQLGSVTFGDQLDVSTLVLSAGPQSTLTLHRLRRDGPIPPESPEQFWDSLPDGELRVEHLNRWITPGGVSNTELASTAPVGFAANLAPAAPSGHSPRGRIRRARETGSFQTAPAGTAQQSLTLSYTVDVARDLNAVGLLYFAAYSGFTDWALSRAWLAWGRTERSFLGRVVQDQELLYLGNADPGARLDITVRRRPGPGHEVIDVVVTRAEDGVRLSISTLTLQEESA